MLCEGLYTERGWENGTDIKVLTKTITKYNKVELTVVIPALCDLPIDWLYAWNFYLAIFIVNNKLNFNGKIVIKDAIV